MCSAPLPLLFYVARAAAVLPSIGATGRSGVVQGTQVAVVPRPLLLAQASSLENSLGHADCHDVNVDVYGHNSADNSKMDVN